MNFSSETDMNDSAGFYLVSHEVFCKTLQETEVAETFELGSITIYFGKRQGRNVWIVDNPSGVHEYHYPVWVETHGPELLS